MPVEKSGASDVLSRQLDWSVHIHRIEDVVSNNYDNIPWSNGNLSTLVLSFEVRESLDMYYRVGTLIIRDIQAFRAYTPLTGNEVITIKYRNSHHKDNYWKIVHFTIFDIEELENNERDGKYTLLTLNLIEFPAYHFFTVPRLYKTWKWEDNGGVDIASAIQDLTFSINGLSNWYEFDADETIDTKDHRVNFYCPNWTYTQAVKYLNQFAIRKGNDEFPCFYLNCKSSLKDGQKPVITYKSIYSYMADEPRYYNMANIEITHTAEQLKNATPEGKDLYDPVDRIFNRNLKYGNNLRLMNGVVGETLIGFNMEDTAVYYAYNHAKLQETYKGLGFYGTMMPNPYRTGEGTQWQEFKAVPWQKPQQIQNYIKNKFWRSQMENNITMDATTYTNELRQVGERSRLYLPTDRQEIIDPMMSGDWLLWGITDTLVGSEAVSSLTFARDSFFLMRDEYMPEIKSFGDRTIQTK